jgi:glycopeptide antibiotics resistance protein
MLDYEFLYIISIPIYILFVVIIIWKKISIAKIILYTLFYFYIISIIAVTIFPIPIQGLKEIWIYWHWNNNFIPLKSITDILTNDSLSFMIKIKQIIWNIVLFIPMWLFIPLIWKSKDQFIKALPIGIIWTFCIELIQYLISLLLGFSYKITDIDDILLNTSGFIIGFLLYKLFQISIEKE